MSKVDNTSLQQDYFDCADWEKLVGWTQAFWNKGEDQRWDYYLGPLDNLSDVPPKPLLHIEMACATKSPEGLPQVDLDRPLTLAFLVGESFEPLLQTIWAYQPTRLLPLVNKYYGDRERVPGGYHQDGRKQWDALLKLIKCLPAEARTRLDMDSLPHPRSLVPVDDNPTAVFEYLRDNLKEDLADTNCEVIIDITGAKKTMVAGAFLFAAYTGAKIAYVDFDRYDKDKGKPYGFTCRLIEVTNPLREWALFNWERVAELYRQHDFAAALTLLPAKLPAGAYTWQDSLENLRHFLEMCHAWENGHLRSARSKLALLPAELRQLVPLSVESLYAYWPETDTPRDEWVSADFLLDPRALLIYGKEELQRCRRLIRQENTSHARHDNRAAFTRAYALHETLIKARVVTLFQKGFVWVRQKKKENAFRSTELEGEWHIIGLRWLLNRMQPRPAHQLITTATENQPVRCQYWEVAENREYPELWRMANENTPVYDPSPYLTETAGKSFTDLAQELENVRHLVVHTYVPVTDEMAGAAIHLAEANLEDYRQRWGKVVKSGFDPDEEFNATRFDAPAWETLKQTCRLDFIPDPNK